MDQKRLLIESADIKQIVEKNQEIIEAMKKLNQLLDIDPITKSTRREKPKVEFINITDGSDEEKNQILQ